MKNLSEVDGPMTTKILVTGTSVRPELLQPLIEAGYTVDNPTHLLSEDELKKKLETSCAYLVGGDEYASRVALSSAKQLKVVAFLGVGYESFIDAAAAKDLGIPVTNTPGTLSNSVAEFTVGLILNSTRRIFLYACDYAAGRSGSEEKQHNLSNLHVGIVGLGEIGTRIAGILRNGFSSKVSYYSRTRKPLVEDQLGISYLPLDQLSSEVDILVVMTPGNEETKGLIGHTQVATFRQGMILINTARADIVDPAALLAGIEGGKIGYAAFDGFYEHSPELAQKLKALISSKLMVTGHIASLTHEARDGMAIRATQSILNILKTGKDQFIVNGP
jgi:glyoxylate reductase